MKKKSQRLLAGFVAIASAVTMLTACGGGANGNNSTTSGKTSTGSSKSAASKPSSAASSAATDDKPIEISMYMPDNATLPYKQDWLTFETVQKNTNVKLNVEAIPIADYQTKVSLALNTADNAPDVILYQSSVGENASLALNGAIVPISDYSDWTPNYNAWVEKLGLKEDVERLKLKDGKLYYMPALYDKPFYDGGLLLREDFLKKKGFDAPKTFDVI